jgi:hypothetical protein
MRMKILFPIIKSKYENNKKIERRIYFKIIRNLSTSREMNSLCKKDESSHKNCFSIGKVNANQY